MHEGKVFFPAKKIAYFVHLYLQQASESIHN